MNKIEKACYMELMTHILSLEAMIMSINNISCKNYNELLEEKRKEIEEKIY